MVVTDWRLSENDAGVDLEVDTKVLRSKEDVGRGVVSSNLDVLGTLAVEVGFVRLGLFLKVGVVFLLPFLEAGNGLVKPTYEVGSIQVGLILSPEDDVIRTTVSSEGVLLGSNLLKVTPPWSSFEANNEVVDGKPGLFEAGVVLGCSEDVGCVRLLADFGACVDSGAFVGVVEEDVLGDNGLGQNKMSVNSSREMGSCGENASSH